MVILSQKDPRWGGKTIGNSKTTIAQAGCVLTSLSMLTDWAGCYKDPAWMAKNLSFLKDLVIWKSVTEKTCLKFLWRQYGYSEGKILESLRGKDTCCLIQIYSNHWVVGIKKIANYYWVADPFTKSRRFIPVKAVSGSAHLTR